VGRTRFWTRWIIEVPISVADPDHLDAEADLDPDPMAWSLADPDLIIISINWCNKICCFKMTYLVTEKLE
jgi:hypothetical protein